MAFKKTINLKEEFKVVQELFNNFAVLGHENTSKHDDYKSYYTASSRRVVEQLYEKDF